MGLLDDAIREHLDLKRARGGDPAEIERMEREALGPVRREPTIGSTRFEPADEHLEMAAPTGYPDDRDELLNAGYHDSTAPHQHPHHEHVHHEHDDAYAEHEHEDPFASAPEQPKRRFLRRNRPSSLSDPDLPDADLHADHGLQDHELHEHAELESHGMFEHEAPIEHDEPLNHHEEAVQQHEPLEQDQPLAQHGSGEPAPVQDDEQDQHAVQEQPLTPPPHLQFDQPPKRPRFSAEPPSAQDEGGDEPQETTEFDVQKHIAETRFQPDAETRVHQAPAPPAGANPDEDEDVLEETPEFLQDTPEHDRLWFEQRPPRDFDFDG